MHLAGIMEILSTSTRFKRMREAEIVQFLTQIVFSREKKSKTLTEGLNYGSRVYFP